MSDLQEQFASAAQEAKQLSKRPDNDTLLKLYALYKQATHGDVSGKRPGFTDPAGRAKFDAWSMLEQMPQDQAMLEYIGLVNRLKK